MGTLKKGIEHWRTFHFSTSWAKITYRPTNTLWEFSRLALIQSEFNPLLNKRTLRVVMLDPCEIIVYRVHSLQNDIIFSARSKISRRAHWSEHLANYLNALLVCSPPVMESKLYAVQSVYCKSHWSTPKKNICYRSEYSILHNLN